MQDAEGKLHVLSTYCKAKDCARCWPGYRANVLYRVEHVFGACHTSAYFLFIFNGKSVTSARKALSRAGASYVGFRLPDGSTEFLVAAQGGVPGGWKPLPDWRERLRGGEGRLGAVDRWDRSKRLLSSHDVNAAQRPTKGLKCVAFTSRDVEWVVEYAESKRAETRWAGPDAAYITGDATILQELINELSN